MTLLIMNKDDNYGNLMMIKLIITIDLKEALLEFAIDSVPQKILSPICMLIWG